MRRNRTAPGIAILILVAALNLSAQERVTLTIQESVDMALAKNPEIRMAEKELAKARAGVWEATSNILPQVNGYANLQHAWDIQRQTIPNFLKPMLGPLVNMIPELSGMPDYVQLSFGMENTLTYGATLTQPLFLGGAGVSAIKMAAAGKRAAEQNLESKRQNLIYQTASAFYACLLAQELAAVQEEALGQAQANLDVVTKKFSVGSASGFDKMRAEVEVANLKPEVISAKNNLQLAVTGLRTVLGLPRATEIQMEGSLAYAEDDFSNMTLEEFQNRALTARPEILAMKEQKLISSKGVTVAASAFMPKLFFQTDYSYMAMKNSMRFTQGDFSKGFTSAVSLQLPLFTGFKNSKQYQKARLDQKIMGDTEKQLFDGIAADAEVSYNKFQEAKQKYLAAKESSSLAQEALRLANLMYAEGANTQLDVLNSQLAVNRAKLNYVSSLYEYQMARYQLRRAVGKLTAVL
ncbi:MAG TPA: TolC family protein [bacterium]|nr:TolC family protein [bacterium]HQG46604.1 TolC family protein [bacterium]HQI47113.1 TolC family protein [bacterium]HQJ63169.1 TolC family protein [bacterium]